MRNLLQDSLEGCAVGYFQPPEKYASTAEPLYWIISLENYALMENDHASKSIERNMYSKKSLTPFKWLLEQMSCGQDSKRII